MEISYKALCSYLPEAAAHTPEAIASILTSIGLEVESVEEVESIRGGLKGIVVGEVLTCIDHPNSDHLHITTVNIGEEHPLQIVCGAPNVAAGQKVPVATIGTELYDGDTSFKIKKGKLRGEESFGMICSEKEIGVGEDTSGIMVLPSEVAPGTPAADYFGVSSDYCISVDITPNRVDATSFFGIARDLAAYLSAHGTPCRARLPKVEPIAATPEKGITVALALPPEECPRYSGVTLKNISQRETPTAIRDVLTTIGQRSINLIVDISNYVLFETGQPLHMFDADKIKNATLTVEHLPAGTPFVTLDGVTHTLDGSEIMITNEHKPLCMAGIYGGVEAEVTNETTAIFIESANFHPTTIRKAARKHALSTDSSFRFERGLDPANTHYALQRAVSLLVAYGGAEVVGDVIDIQPLPLPEKKCSFSLAKMDALIGFQIPREKLRTILDALDMKILDEQEDHMELALPAYRSDVYRQADVIEEILRIYGYNEIPLSGYITANLSTRSEADEAFHTENIISEQLVGAGYNEILCNSLSAEKYYQPLETLPLERAVRLLNPLSGELSVMRQTLLFGGLEAIGRNLRSQQTECLFFEWGNVYAKETSSLPSNNLYSGKSDEHGYQEAPMLGLWIAGRMYLDNWHMASREADVFRLKADLENIFVRLGFNPNELSSTQLPASDIFSQQLLYTTKSGEELARLGIVAPAILKQADLDSPVFFAEIRSDRAFALARRQKLQVSDINKYPFVTRDFALLIDECVSFQEIKDVAQKAAGTLLKKIALFDVYQGDKLPKGKISYAIRFRLQDDKSTLQDKQIDKTMQRIRTALESQLGASIR